MKSIDIKIMMAARRAEAERTPKARAMVATGPAQAEYVRELMSRFPRDCCATEPRRKQKEQEQAAFEDWIEKSCPSGDVDEVHGKWGASYERAIFLESQSDPCAVFREAQARGIVVEMRRKAEGAWVVPAGVGLKSWKFTCHPDRYRIKPKEPQNAA